MEAALIRKCNEEPEFRVKVIANPKGMFEEALGQKLPDNVSVFIHEEDLHNIHFSIPPTREILQKELSDEQLEQVAGGTDPITGLVVMTALGIGFLVTGTIASITATVSASALGTAIGATVGKSKGW
jgi:hypothetical protein